MDKKKTAATFTEQPSGPVLTNPVGSHSFYVIVITPKGHFSLQVLLRHWMGPLRPRAVPLRSSGLDLITQGSRRPKKVYFKPGTGPTKSAQCIFHRMQTIPGRVGFLPAKTSFCHLPVLTDKTGKNSKNVTKMLLGMHLNWRHLKDQVTAKNYQGKWDIIISILSTLNHFQKQSIR